MYIPVWIIVAIMIYLFVLLIKDPRYEVKSETEAEKEEREKHVEWVKNNLIK